MADIDYVNAISNLGSVFGKAAAGSAGQREREQSNSLTADQIDRRSKLLAALMSGVEDASVTSPNRNLQARVPTVTGGLRPSAITGGGRREQLVNMLNTPVDRNEAGWGEKLLGGLGTGASILGAAGPIISKIPGTPGWLKDIFSKPPPPPPIPGGPGGNTDGQILQDLGRDTNPRIETPEQYADRTAKRRTSDEGFFDIDPENVPDPNRRGGGTTGDEPPVRDDPNRLPSPEQGEIVLEGGIRLPGTMYRRGGPGGMDMFIDEQGNVFVAGEDGQWHERQRF